MLSRVSWQRTERLSVAARLIERLHPSIYSTQPEVVVCLLYPLHSHALATRTDDLDDLRRYGNRRCVRSDSFFDWSGASNGRQPREMLCSWPDWRLAGRLYRR